MTERCQATKAPVGWMAFIRASNLGHNRPVRCGLDAGHDGAHRATFQPFPGFVDELLVWRTPVVPELPEVPA